MRFSWSFSECYLFFDEEVFFNEGNFLEKFFLKEVSLGESFLNVACFQ